MRKIFTLIITVVFLSGTAGAGAAQDKVTLDSLIRAAKENNKEIIASREQWQASRARITGAKTWENPTLFADYWSVPEGTLDLPAAPEKMYGVEQMIPFPGKLRARGKAADFEAEGMAAEYRGIELSVLSRLKKTYAMYYYLDKAITTYRETAELLRSFSRIAESRYVVGKSAQSDVLRAQVEAEKMANMVITLEQEKETAKIELNLLIGKIADEPLGEPADLAPPPSATKSWEEIKAASLEYSPEIAKAAAMVGEKRWMKRMATLEYLPDFDVSFRRKMMNGMWAGSDVMLGLSVPLWFWKQRSDIRAASSALKAAEAEKVNSDLMAVSRAKEAFTRLDASRRLAELYATSVVPKSEQALTVAQSSFVAGTASFLELLDTLRSYLEFKLESYNYVAEYHKNLAELESITGAELSEGGAK